MAELITYVQDGAIVTLTLNRPALRNPISDGDMVDALVAALDKVNGDSGARVAILTGSGSTFSSGGNLKLMGAAVADRPPVETRRYYETGTRMPVAVFLGGDPVFTFAATTPLPDGLDEFLLAGYLRKKSVELVKCETNDLEVPANADFVIEGYVDPKEPLREEGPFGDHTGYYSLPDLYPVFHITAITHRKDAVYPATIVGIPPMEDFYIGSASVRLFLPIFKMNFPEIVDIALPAEGVFHNLVFVSIKKSYPMQAFKIMHGLWGMGQMMFTKYIIVVDADVNVHNTSEVMFRMCANTDPQRDSIFTKGPADVLDHATTELAVGSKMGIDATHKLTGEGHKRGWPPLIKLHPNSSR
jgi:4-hydroxy-3-polyprenylbenzoate decarboxylase